MSVAKVVKTDNEPLDFNAGISIVEMLGRANYIALVGGGKQPKFPQNKVIIWDDAKQKAVITLEFRTQVHRVRLSRSRIVVALQNSIHMYAFSSPPEKLSVFETADNLNGLCCLGTKIVAFPGNAPGRVQLVEIDTGNVSIIPAHGSPLRAMELSPDGQVLATASETGTLIRIFATSNCARIAELRRGVDQATIYSVGISPDNTLLAVTSDKSTLHIFDLPHPLRDDYNNSPQIGTASSIHSVGSIDEAPNQKWGLLGKIPLLPRFFSDIYSFTSARFETVDDPSIGGVGAPYIPIPGVPGGKAAKGIIGWLNEYTIMVIGAGRDGRWERFIVGTADDGKRHCIRNGWKRYLGS
ncbi:Phosphatidylinositol 3,5-bisphosphate-binding protein [Xylographa carneopallida]|nr:Phosphatidylinositol 3,5-bisphosphate-binding protein [Xylographa carneopallida]